MRWGGGQGVRGVEEWGGAAPAGTVLSTPLQMLAGPWLGRHKAGARLAWLRC